MCEPQGRRKGEPSPLRRDRGFQHDTYARVRQRSRRLRGRGAAEPYGRDAQPTAAEADGGRLHGRRIRGRPRAVGVDARARGPRGLATAVRADGPLGPSGPRGERPRGAAAAPSVDGLRDVSELCKLTTLNFRRQVRPRAARRQREARGGGPRLPAAPPRPVGAPPATRGARRGGAAPLCEMQGRDSDVPDRRAPVAGFGGPAPGLTMRTITSGSPRRDRRRARGRHV